MRIAGTTPGGVVLPTQAMAQTADSVIFSGADPEPFRAGDGGGFQRPMQSPLEDEIATELRLLAEPDPFPIHEKLPLAMANRYYMGDPATPQELPGLAWVSWCKADSLKEKLGMRADCSFVIPLVADVARIKAMSYGGAEQLQAWLEPAEPGDVEILIGWSPTEPVLGNAHPILGENHKPPIFGEKPFSGSTFEGLNGRPGGAVYVHGDPFAGGISYVLPVTWVNSPYPLDCLQVGQGNYNPTAKLTYDSGAFGVDQSAMRPFSAAIRKDEKEHSRAFRKHREEEAIRAAHKVLGENREKRQQFERSAQLWKGVEGAAVSLFLWETEHGGDLRGLEKEMEALQERESEAFELEEPARGVAVRAVQATIKTLEESLTPLREAQGRLGEELAKRANEFGVYVGFVIKNPEHDEELGDVNRVFTDATEKIREKYGPYRLGVKKWAYRFRWDKPPGGLPDLSTAGGYFVMMVRAKPGVRWLHKEGPEARSMEVQQGRPILGAGLFAAGAQLLGAVES